MMHVRGEKLYTDTMFAMIWSFLQSNMCAQVWTNGLGYNLFYPLKSKMEAPTIFWKMVQDLQVIPEVIIVSDGLGEQTRVNWKDEITLHNLNAPSFDGVCISVAEQSKA
jgi:hypothetical protein